MPPWLTQPEIDDLCAPLTQAAAQIRYLRGEGLTVRTKPNGYPLVMRAHVEAVLNPTAGQMPSSKREPNRLALVATFARS